MKIIEIGICLDNIDPKGLGRIRCIRYNDYISGKEKATKYTPWDKTDPFVASPFLPTNINFIPENGQAVKIINYNPNKETVNQEYIAGPFTTTYDFNGQTYSQQISNTTYGVFVQDKPDIRDKSGLYRSKTENSFANEKDFAVYGKFGSDVLFTENGLQLRGGKLLSKDAASLKNREILINEPIFAKKSSNFYLKKFPKKMILREREITQRNYEIKNLNYLVEYEIDNLNPTEGNPATIKVYVYKVLSEYGNVFKTDFFNISTVAPGSLLQLINEDNSSTTPTFTETVTDIIDASKQVRSLIFDIHDLNLSEINPLYTDEDIHPFYFRPSSTMFSLSPANTTEKDNKQFFIQNISVARVGPTAGLIWSQNSVKVPFKDGIQIEQYLEIDENSPEQTFSAIKSDKVFLLSTDLGENESVKSIPFYDLNKYEYTQENYIKDIEPNTFSTVRGENLLAVLKAIINVIFTHRHNPLKPIIGQTEYQEGEELKELLKTLENDILNKSIRIN
jgi:hypothetical protein